METKKVFALEALMILAMLVVTLPAAGKVKFGTSVKISPAYYLPMMAAEEKGFWKHQGLEVEWLPLAGSRPLNTAVVTGDILVGGAAALAQVMGISRGVPLLMVLEMVSSMEWVIYVRADAPYKQPRDLKGGKIGVIFLGDLSDAFGRAVVRALGIEKDVKFVAVGGVPQQHASLRAGATDGMVVGRTAVVGLELAGIARPFVRVNDYLPKEWMEHTAFARRDFAAKQPGDVRKVVKGLWEAIKYVKANRSWNTEKLRTVSGLPEEGAKIVLSGLQFSHDGKIRKEAVENIGKFALEYKLVRAGSVPPAAELFTNEFFDGS